MQCKCGFETPESAKFCPECGKKTPQLKPQIPQVADEIIIKQVDALLKPDEAARFLKISRWKLDELRVQKKLPRECYAVLSGVKKKTVRYRAKELLAWAGATEGPITTTG